MTIGGLAAVVDGGFAQAADAASRFPETHFIHRSSELFRLLISALLGRHRLCLIGRLVLNHTVTDVHQFSHGCTQCAHFRLVRRQQPFIKGLNIRILAGGYHGREVKLYCPDALQSLANHEPADQFRVIASPHGTD